MAHSTSACSGAQHKHPRSGRIRGIALELIAVIVMSTDPSLLACSTAPKRTLQQPPNLCDLLYDGFYLVFLLKNRHVPDTAAGLAGRFKAFLDGFGGTRGASDTIPRRSTAPVRALRDRGRSHSWLWHSRCAMNGNASHCSSSCSANFSPATDSSQNSEQLRGRADNVEVLEVFHVPAARFQGRYLLEGTEKLGYLAPTRRTDSAYQGKRQGFAPHWPPGPHQPRARTGASIVDSRDAHRAHRARRISWLNGHLGAEVEKGWRLRGGHQRIRGGAEAGDYAALSAAAILFGSGRRARQAVPVWPRSCTMSLSTSPNRRCAMRTVLAVVALALAVLAAPLVFLPGGPGGIATTETPPWEIVTTDEGHSRVFGLTLGESTLGDAMQALGQDIEIAIITAPGEQGRARSLLRLHHLRAGDRKAGADGTDRRGNSRSDDSARHQDRVHGEHHPQVGAPPDDLARALTMKVRAVGFIPSINLDEQTIVTRFGEPLNACAAATGSNICSTRPGPRYHPQHDGQGADAIRCAGKLRDLAHATRRGSFGATGRTGS